MGTFDDDGQALLHYLGALRRPRGAEFTWKRSLATAGALRCRIHEHRCYLVELPRPAADAVREALPVSRF